MKIKITQFGNQGFRADCTDLPGSPPVGSGPTPEAALVELFFMILFMRTTGGIHEIVSQDETWLKFLSYAKGYGMTCENYRPLIAIENPLAQTPSIPDQIKKAVDEIISRESHIPDETTGQDCLSREQLEELLGRYFNQPFELSGSVARAIEGSSPKPPDPSWQETQRVMDVQAKEMADARLKDQIRALLEKDDIISDRASQFLYEAETIDKLAALVRAARNDIGSSPNTPGQPNPEPPIKEKFGAPRGIIAAAQEDFDKMRADPRIDPSCHQPPGLIDTSILATPPMSLPGDKPIKYPGVSVRHIDEDVVHGNPDDPEVVAADSEFIIKEVTERASLLFQDNPTLSRALIESAMLIGASIAMERSSSKLLADHLAHRSTMAKPTHTGE